MVVTNFRAGRKRIYLGEVSPSSFRTGEHIYPLPILLVIAYCIEVQCGFQNVSYCIKLHLRIFQNVFGCCQANIEGVCRPVTLMHKKVRVLGLANHQRVRTLIRTEVPGQLLRLVPVRYYLSRLL